jgi:hypothetical protein
MITAPLGEQLLGKQSIPSFSRCVQGVLPKTRKKEVRAQRAKKPTLDYLT